MTMFIYSTLFISQIPHSYNPLSTLSIYLHIIEPYLELSLTSQCPTYIST